MPLLDADERAQLRAAQAGSVSDFESLFRAHWPRAFRASYLIVLDHAAAEEIVVESFLGAVRVLDSFGPERPFAAWLHRLVVNRSVDRARSRLLQPTGLREGVGESTESLDWAMPMGGPHLEREAYQLAAGLASLSPDLRAVLVLRYILEYSPREMSPILDVPRTTAASRLDEATERLRGRLFAEVSLDEKRLRALLLQQPVPGEHLAIERTWEVVRGAYAAREATPHRRRRFPWRLTLAVVVLAAAGVAVWLSPASDRIADWFRGEDGGGETTAAPVVSTPATRLPAPGKVLVTAGGLVSVLDASGDQAALGEYAGASWSASGRFVAAWRRTTLVGLDPTEPDLPLWTVDGRGIDDARWSEDGFRVAYRARRLLRLVDGSGNRGKIVARDVSRIAPAWQPGVEEHVLAYAEEQGRVRVVDADTRKVLWQFPAKAVVGLAWTADGERLAALSADSLRVVEPPRRAVVEIRLPSGVTGTAVAARPGDRQEVAYAIYSRASGTSSVFVVDPESKSSEILFAGAGRIGTLAWSPDGRYLLVPWREAGQWLFVPIGQGAAVAAIADASSEVGGGEFPRVDGWCCTAE